MKERNHTNQQIVKIWAPWCLSGKKNPPANARDVGSIPGWGRSPGERNGNSLQYSCLVNPKDRGTWQVTVHGVTKSQTWLVTHRHTENGSSVLDARWAQIPVAPRYLGTQRDPEQAQGQRAPLRVSGHTALRGHVFRLNWDLPERRKKTLTFSERWMTKKPGCILSHSCAFVSAKYLRWKWRQEKMQRRSNPEFLFRPVCPDSSVNCCWNACVLRSEIKTVEWVLCSASIAVASTKHRPVDKLQNANCVTG